MFFHLFTLGCKVNQYETETMRTACFSQVFGYNHTMRKTRLYLESSSIIMMSPGQDPVRQGITKEFFRVVSENPDEYELLLSPVTIGELGKAKTEEKRKANADFLQTIQYVELPENDDAENLARIYTIDGVLSQANTDDLRHVAFAVVARCDYVVTWNMRHLANDKTVSRVNTVNAVENYGKLFITTPAHFTKGGSYGQCPIE